MRAAHYIGNRAIRVDDVPIRHPGPGQVGVDVAYTGICGTDLHILHGDMDSRVTRPAVIGHEMAGTVNAIGAGVSGWSAGDRVTVMPLRWDGTCPACRAGNTHICQNLDFLGIDSAGSMQNTWIVPADVLVRLPDDMPLAHGALVEPTAVAVHDVRRGGVTDGETAVVVGGGPIGLLIACVARTTGADVVVLELDEHRRRVAEGVGFRALDPARDDIGRLVGEWTGGAGAAIAFEVSASQAGVESALSLLSVRGRLVVVGIHSAPRLVDLHRVFWRELSLVGARVYERADYERAVDLLHSGAIPAQALISKIVSLDDAAEAFELLEGGGDVVKVLIDCQAGAT